jgi:hypothetical protein
MAVFSTPTRSKRGAEVEMGRFSHSSAFQTGRRGGKWAMISNRMLRGSEESAWSAIAGELAIGPGDRRACENALITGIA